MSMGDFRSGDIRPPHHDQPINLIPVSRAKSDHFSTRMDEGNSVDWSDSDESADRQDAKRIKFDKMSAGQLSNFPQPQNVGSRQAGDTSSGSLTSAQNHAQHIDQQRVHNNNLPLDLLGHFSGQPDNGMTIANLTESLSRPPPWQDMPERNVDDGDDWGFLPNIKTGAPFAGDADDLSRTVGSGRASSVSSYGSADSGVSYPPRERKKEKKALRMKYSEFKAQAKKDAHEDSVPEATSHIEKRYRNNLNGRLQSLRTALPKEIFSHRDKEGDFQDESDSRKRKVGKAEVMEKAVEYIKALEKQQEQLQSENVALQRRLVQLETSAKVMA